MTYLKVKWIHATSYRPVLTYSELDDERSMRQRDMSPRATTLNFASFSFTMAVYRRELWI
jgi:uncharacterized protein DUF6881